MCLGVVAQDFVFSVAEMPKAAIKYRAADFATVGGGCAGNAAVTVARLGGRGAVITRLGRDRTGDDVVADLEGEGVDCTYAARLPDVTSSLSAVLVDSAGERLIVNYRDPRLPDATDWLPDFASTRPQAVLADTRWPAGAAALFRSAREHGVPAVLDAEPPVHAAAEALALATHVAFSRDGLTEWSGIDELAPALRFAAERTGVFVCVTDGGRGVHYRVGEWHGHVPAFPVAAVDTLGAGDIWHGAFALALAEGVGDVAAIRFASATAALKCTRFGGRAAIPSRAQVDALLKEHAS